MTTSSQLKSEIQKLCTKNKNATTKYMEHTGMDRLGELSDEQYPVPVEFNHHMEFDYLDYWLARFVFEIRREDGKLYPQRTLGQICSGIQRHLRQDCNRVEDFLKTTDPIFQTFRRALDSRMKDFTAEGVGTVKNKA